MDRINPLFTGGTDFPVGSRVMFTGTYGVFEDGDLAERYGYVNRAIPEDEFENFVGRFAHRVATFDRQALAEIKHFINNVSRPADEEFPPQMDASCQAVARPALQARASKMFELGLQQRSEVELRLAKYVGQLTEEG